MKTLKNKVFIHVTDVPSLNTFISVTFFQINAVKFFLINVVKVC